jgi:hypothetical protein
MALLRRTNLVERQGRPATTKTTAAAVAGMLFGGEADFSAALLTVIL